MITVYCYMRNFHFKILVFIECSVCVRFGLRTWKKVKVLVTQSCPTLCDPLNCNSVHGILQARILERVPILFSRVSPQPRDWTPVSYIAGRFFYCLSHQESLRTSCVLNHLFLPIVLGTYSPIIPILMLTKSSPRVVGLFAQGHKARNG